MSVLDERGGVKRSGHTSSALDDMQQCDEVRFRVMERGVGSAYAEPVL